MLEKKNGYSPGTLVDQQSCIILNLKYYKRNEQVFGQSTSGHIYIRTILNLMERLTESFSRPCRVLSYLNPDYFLQSLYRKFPGRLFTIL